jgi:hypothetical protein
LHKSGQRILNHTAIIVYTLLFSLAAALVEALLRSIVTGVPDGLYNISSGLAEMGITITVIAVSILTVIANLSTKRYFGITVGEYLNYGQSIVKPSFYDVLIIIVLLGAVQYAALAAQAMFAAAVLFIEIIALMIVQIRWGLSIAFFHYVKEKEIRTMLVADLENNAGIIADPKNQSRAERAAAVMLERIDQLMLHTRQAALSRSNAELTSNLAMLTTVFKLLINPSLERVWHNFETRLDHLLYTLLQDSEQREYAVGELTNLIDIVIKSMDWNENEQGIVKNCDFDNSRNQAYELLSYADPSILKSMFEKHIFYKLAVVKIFGIVDETRKISRYMHYAGQFAASAAESKYIEEITDMTEESILELAPLCFANAKIKEAGYYTCLLIESLESRGISLESLGEKMLKRYFGDDAKDSVSDAGKVDEARQKSVYMLMLAEKNTLGIDSLPDRQLDDEDNALLETCRKLSDMAKQKTDA